VPPLHVEHTELPAIAYVPAAQLWQVLAASFENVPAAQLRQSESCHHNHRVRRWPRYLTSSRGIPLDAVH